MPISSAISAGAQGLASQYNNLRIDAMARIETVTAGESYAATTAVTNAGSNQAYSLPTLLQQDSGTGKWFKMDGDTVGLGARVRVGMAYEASAGDGSSVKIYLPGSLITGLSAMTAEVGRTASNSSTSGAVESTVLPPYHTYIGWWPSATSFMFEGLMFNNVNPKQIGTPVVSGEAFSVRDALYVKVSDGRAYRADGISFEGGQCITPLFAAQAATGAAQTVLAYTPGAYITGFSGLTVGVPYFAGTTGALSTTPGKFFRVLGYAVSSTEFIFSPGRSNENYVLQGVVAGENWTAGEALYQKKSDGRYYRADTDVAESGICENPAFAFSTVTGGAGTDNNLAYFPGSLVFNLISVTAGDRVYPSATTGGITVNTPPSYDTYYRVLGFAFRTNSFNFNPQEMQFLPTGIQEKGFVAAGYYGSSSIPHAYSTVNFKKIMVNTPSSITFTLTYNGGAPGTMTPTAYGISRFGFLLDVWNTTANSFSGGWTYQTVGN